MNNDTDPKIEFVSEAVESTGDHQYRQDGASVMITKEQTALSVIGLVLAVPFPILIIILWVTLNTIKAQHQALGDGTMSAVFLYLLQFFIVPLLSLTSIIIAFIVTVQSKATAKNIGYISLGVTGVGCIILGLFLNHS